jgi:hypothetical protein
MKTVFSIENYKQIIVRSVKNKENFIISNGHPEHASYILATFFKEAKSEVRIFTGKLFKSVFDNHELINNAIDFLRTNKNGKLKIAFDEKVSPFLLMGQNFLGTIFKNADIKDRVELWDSSLGFDVKMNHFAIMDKSAFRYELNHDRSEAIANFGDSQAAMTLYEFFNYIIKNSKRIEFSN